MYRYFSKREQLAYVVSFVVNALIADVILYSIYRPAKPLSFLIYWFISVLAFQLYAMFAPEFIQKLFQKGSPLEEQLILRRKIKCIEEEIKRINRQPYNKDVFRGY